MCQILNDEHPCLCSDDAMAAFDPKLARAAIRRLEALFAPALLAPAPQVVATMVAIPSTSELPRHPLLPYTGTTSLSPDHHWGVVVTNG